MTKFAYRVIIVSKLTISILTTEVLYGQKFSLYDNGKPIIIPKKVLDALSPYKLTAGQPKVLDYLGRHNGCMQKSIATGCQIEPATLTGILSRMEEKKLIIRQTKDGNKRSLYVYLTDEGKRLQEIVNDTFEKVENEILGGISESEKEQFINTFFKICNNMTNTEELQ